MIFFVKDFESFSFFFLGFFFVCVFDFCFHYLYIQLNNKNIINLFVIFNFNTRVMPSLYESYDDEDGGVRGGGGVGGEGLML